MLLSIDTIKKQLFYSETEAKLNNNFRKKKKFRLLFTDPLKGHKFRVFSKKTKTLPKLYELYKFLNDMIDAFFEMLLLKYFKNVSVVHGRLNKRGKPKR